MSRRFLFLLPLILIAALGIGLWFGLQRDPQALPSALINKPVPEFPWRPSKGPRGVSAGTTSWAKSRW